MSSHKPGENLTKGILKRILNYISANYYQRRLNRNDYFDKTWDDLKWKLRFGRIVYFFAFYMGTKYFFIDKIFANFKNLNENKRNLFLDKVDKLAFNIEKNENPSKIKGTENIELEHMLINKLNELNEGIFLIETISINDINKQYKAFNLQNTSGKKGKKNILSFKDLSQLEKCFILEDIYKAFKGNTINSNDSENEKFNFFEKILLYKVTNILSNSQINEETEESQNFIK